MIGSIAKLIIISLLILYFSNYLGFYNFIIYIYI